ncbi:hypothetical protein ZWY2020_046401 [Hordeum vulgare]|nr:hypothetical protein ZWY2020_046401 [Hordeum vulgare]
MTAKTPATSTSSKACMPPLPAHGGGAAAVRGPGVEGNPPVPSQLLALRHRSSRCRRGSPHPGHALVGDTICFSISADEGATTYRFSNSAGVEGAGTYCFHIATREWSKARDWLMPFHGKADYVPELGLWFGISSYDNLPFPAPPTSPASSKGGSRRRKRCGSELVMTCQRSGSPTFCSGPSSRVSVLAGSIHIVKCGDLKVVFPVHPDLKEDVLEFPSLKHIHLYELYKLQHICEVKMHAPKLERVWLRGCWSLRRLPAVSRHSGPIVDCEKGWWEKLEWDGLEVGHHPSLFKPRHSSHYKKSLPRGSVLW